ncbi:MAG: DsbC family protein [Candidatus Nitrotoga sp.]|nr:DsbC family protein [Candidatus Nitrotoga sp.]MDP1856569.1 DsbC family protein [Candidatus Nitrotoga sp.]
MIKLFLVLLASLSFSYAHADAAKVKDILQKNYPQLGKIEKTNKANILGLYEVVAQGQLFYTDEKAQYLISGNIIDLKTMRNLTEERSHKLFAIDFNSLPFDLAIKKVKGNGQRKMAYFSDPNCGFCKKLENELKNVDNVTLYLFMLSIFQGSDKKVQGVWCSKDQVKAWDNLMLNNVQPPVGTCDAPTAKLMDLSQKLNINGTPALIFADGVLVPGFRPAAELEKSLNSPVTR